MIEREIRYVWQWVEVLVGKDGTGRVEMLRLRLPMAQVREREVRTENTMNRLGRYHEFTGPWSDWKDVEIVEE